MEHFYANINGTVSRDQGMGFLGPMDHFNIPAEGFQFGKVDVWG